jgi:O-antigen/teichoic acid export membrane protein
MVRRHRARPPGKTSRSPVAGVVDQVLSSGTNFFTAFVASYVLTPPGFGTFVVGYAVITIMGAFVRAAVGDPLLAHLSVVPPERQEATLRTALSSAVCLGLGGSLLCLAAGRSGIGALSALAWLAPWVPIAILQDAFRYAFLARSCTRSALTIDTAWAVGQVVALGVIAATGSWSVPSLSVAWGIGATCGVLAAAVLAPGLLRPADPRRWLRDSGYLSGWLTLTSVLGQAEIYALLLMAGLVLDPVDAAGLRAVQLLIFQPAVTLLAAMLVLVTPVVARAVAIGDLARIRSARRSALVGGACIAGVVLLAVPLRMPLLSLLFPQYTGFDDLVLPIALDTALVALVVPFQAMLRGYRRVRTEFLIKTVSATCLVVLAAVGTVLAGVEGIAWAMPANAVLVLASFVWLTPRPDHAGRIGRDGAPERPAPVVAPSLPQA